MNQQPDDYEDIENYTLSVCEKCIVLYSMSDRRAAYCLNQTQAISRDIRLQRLQRLLRREDQLRFIGVFLQAVGDM